MLQMSRTNGSAPLASCWPIAEPDQGDAWPELSCRPLKDPLLYLRQDWLTFVMNDIMMLQQNGDIVSLPDIDTPQSTVRISEKDLQCAILPCSFLSSCETSAAFSRSCAAPCIWAPIRLELGHTSTVSLAEYCTTIQITSDCCLKLFYTGFCIGEPDATTHSALLLP